MENLIVFLYIDNPVWDVAILRDDVRKLQRQVHDIKWDLATVRVKMLQEIRRTRRALMLPVEDAAGDNNNNNDEESINNN
ncbi:hypothetical protein P3S67_028936 [Capsicum chacoense]